MRFIFCFASFWFVVVVAVVVAAVVVVVVCALSRFRTRLSDEFFFFAFFCFFFPLCSRTHSLFHFKKGVESRLDLGVWHSVERIDVFLNLHSRQTIECRHITHDMHAFMRTQKASSANVAIAVVVGGGGGGGGGGRCCCTYNAVN